MAEPFAAGATHLTSTVEPDTDARTVDGTPGTLVEVTSSNAAKAESPRAFLALIENLYTAPGVKSSIVWVEVVGLVIEIGAICADSSSIR
jgi:hypothetical protein